MGNLAATAAVPLLKCYLISKNSDETSNRVRAEAFFEVAKKLIDSNSDLAMKCLLYALKDLGDASIPLEYQAFVLRQMGLVIDDVSVFCTLANKISISSTETREQLKNSCQQPFKKRLQPKSLMPLSHPNHSY